MLNKLRERNGSRSIQHSYDISRRFFSRRDILPAELGGSAPPYNNASWAQQLVGDDSSFAFSDKQIFWPKDGGVSPHSPSIGECLCASTIPISLYLKD